ncbi:CPBP family intramembrane glutamic endopeptidase [Deminuibacter soli]|uniref:CPBP family intramembrane glutamic endopeptidase n=1 Tax=Deminuibacter soli TaxID=2291815 RepID=UPI0013149370|nr:CPBP family intramembrane glutamic endopeptidase [Deminuibacter soli]
MLGLFGGCTIIGSVVIFGIAALGWHIPLADIPRAITQPENADLVRLAQGTGALVSMGLPALFFARIVNRFPLRELRFSSRINIKQLIMVVLLVFFALYVSGALAELNERIPIGDKLARRFKQMEKEYDDQVMVLGHMQNLRDYIYTLFIIAFIPAMVEEMYFRGCMQQLMTGWTKSAFTAILITSIVFSAVHISYYGFLPRMFLGFMLGYIFYYSGNIWLNILAHFLNNALVVTQMYILSRQGKLSADAINESYPLYWGLVGIVAIIAVFMYFRKESQKLRLQYPDPAPVHFSDDPFA